MRIHLNDLIQIWGEPFCTKNHNLEVPLGRVCTDSRKFVQGDFFVPLIGENFDGHSFLKHVFYIGAQGAIVSKNSILPIPRGLLHWKVDDTLEAYQQLACLYRSSLSGYVVAVTGSVGKTTTRELIHSVLRSMGSILSSHGNNNNDIGVPFTLLEAHSNHYAIVLEMGMRGLYQIKRLSKCARPDVAVITNIGTAHMSLLGSRENIALAKCEIVSYLNPDGVVIIFDGDPLLEDILNSQWSGRVYRVGINNDDTTEQTPLPLGNSKADLIGYLDEVNWVITVNGQSLKLPLEGRHNAKNFMLALGVALELGVPLDSLQQICVKIPPGRNDVYNIGGITIIDETYNASPESVKASLDFLATKNGRRFAVLGKMLELGNQSASYHKEIAEYAVSSGLNGLLLFGEGIEIKSMYSVAKSLPYVEVVSSPEQAFVILKKWLVSGDYLLLKASRKVALERILPFLNSYY